MTEKVRCPRCGSDELEELAAGFHCRGTCYNSKQCDMEQFNKTYFQYSSILHTYSFTVEEFITIDEDLAERLRSDEAKIYAGVR
jgi:hypothetical protein